MSLLNKQNSGSNKAKPKSNSARELQKLRRMDLLELLLDQVRENEEQAESLAELTDLTARLKDKLNQKDAQIEHLKERLDHKDEQIRDLEERRAALVHAAGLVDEEELHEIEERAMEKYLKEVSAEEH